MNTIAVIARLTFREAIRRRVVLAALLLGIAFLVIYDLGFYFIHQEAMQEGVRGFRNKQMMEQAYNFMVMAGMYVVNFLNIAIAALITADTLAGEIQSGTIQATVTKPIRRAEVVVGKWFGQAFLLLLYLGFLSGGMMLSVLVITGYQIPGWLPGLGLMYFNSLLIMTLTLAFSTSFSTLATGGAVFGAFGVAFIGGWVERIGTVLGNQTAVDLGIFASLLLPSEALWNKAASVMTSPLLRLAEATPFTAASEPSTAMIIYAAVYLLAILGVAIWQFGKRDL